LRALKLVSNRD